MGAPGSSGDRAPLPGQVRIHARTIEHRFIHCRRHNDTSYPYQQPPTRTQPRTSLISPPPWRFPVSTAARLTVPHPLKPPQTVRTQPMRPQAEAQPEALRARSGLGCKHAQRCQTSCSSATSAASSSLPGWHVEAVRMRLRASPRRLIACVSLHQEQFACGRLTQAMPGQFRPYVTRAAG